MTPKPPYISKRVEEIDLPNSMFPANKDIKPIRYFEVIKHYRWGCPECDYTTFSWQILWLHYKEDHGKPPWEYQTPTNEYILKELFGN